MCRGQREDIGLLQLPANIGGAPGSFGRQWRLGKEISHALVEQPRGLGERLGSVRQVGIDLLRWRLRRRESGLLWASPH